MSNEENSQHKCGGAAVIEKKHPDGVWRNVGVTFERMEMSQEDVEQMMKKHDVEGLLANGGKPKVFGCEHEATFSLCHAISQLFFQVAVGDLDFDYAAAQVGKLRVRVIGEEEMEGAAIEAINRIKSGGGFH